MEYLWCHSAGILTWDQNSQYRLFYFITLKIPFYGHETHILSQYITMQSHENLSKLYTITNPVPRTTQTDPPLSTMQGGILAGNLGARLPQNLQTHMKFCQHFTLFWRKFDLKVCISCQIKKFFLSHTTCRKYFLSQEETSWHCTLLISTGRNLLS